MAFTLEDNTGVVGANSYVSVDYYKGYFKDRGITPPGSSGSEIQGFLVQATDYVETEWLAPRQILLGEPLTEDQGLTLPTATCEIDDKLLQAVCLYAKEAGTNGLYGEPQTQGQVKRLKEKVGPIETETEYTELAATSVNALIKKKFRAADRLMRIFLGLPANGGQVIRN